MRAKIKTLIYTGSFILGHLVLTPNNVYAQGKACCNLETKEFTSDTLETCNAKPNHIHLGKNGENMAQIMVCMQNIQNQAAKILQQMGGPGMGGNVPDIPSGPSLPGGGDEQTGMPDDVQDMIDGLMSPTQVSASEYECCNVDDGQFIGSMSAEVCRANSASHFPDIPEFTEQVQACRATSGGGGGAWSKEDYEDNIQNGGMEEWRDKHRPKGFTSYGVPVSVQKKSPIDFQVSFRSSDAHTGQYSLQIKNADIASQLPPEAQAALQMIPGGRDTLTQAGGAGTCKDPCPLESQTPASNGLGAAVQVFGALSTDDVKSHVCGAYKGFIGRTDELALNITLSSGGSAVGSAQQSFTQSSSDWFEFSIPMTSIVGELPEQGKVGIAAQIMARGSSKRIASGGMPMFGQPLSVLTDVKVDSIHFCDPMGLTAYHPEVIAGNTNTKISEKEEDTLGVQTFVNLDNDDEDGKFDGDDDKVEGDNELVRLKMVLPMNSFGKVEFKATGVDSKIALWDDADKSRKFEIVNDEVKVEELLRANADGTKFEREVWVEALMPSKKQGDIEFSFIFKNKLQSYAKTEDKIVFTALGIKDIEFVGKGNSKDDNDTLDPDPNWPSSATGIAYRVFPGKRWDGNAPEDKPRNIVDVKVTLNVSPTRPVDVYFRAFDIDDPTAFDNEVDDESASDDNRGTKPHQWGNFPEFSGKFRKVEFTNDSETFEFQTTMQPGDNFKIVGNGDKKFLEILENDDIKLTEKGPRFGTMIVDKNVFSQSKGVVGKARVRDHDAYVSGALTVWRKMYMEIDTMGPVKGNVVKGTIVSIQMGADISATHKEYKIVIDKNLYKNLQWSSQSDRNAFVDNYFPGTMVIDNYPYQVRGSTAKASGNDEITIAYNKEWKPLNQANIDGPFELKDDDVTQEGDALPNLPMERMAPAFKPAYILPVDSVPNNQTSTTVFRLHYKEDTTKYLRQMYVFDNIAYHDDPEFWLVYLLNAFQGKLVEDGDGTNITGSIAGQADNDPNTGNNGQGAAIYQESGRELELGSYRSVDGDPNATEPTPGTRLVDAPPHEIGHLFGALHSDKGLMTGKGVDAEEDFSPISLDKIRSHHNP